MKEWELYNQIAKYYDLIYEWKDYKKESAFIHKLIQRNKKTKGKELLDVACGTGNHIKYLKKYYSITGLDLNKGMLKIARKKFPELRFVKSDMISFDLKKKFDVIICLFSSIGYLKTHENLRKTIATFSKHIKSGGVLIIEPFVTRGSFISGRLGANFVDKSDVKIARLNVSRRRGNIGVFDFHYLIATKKGVKYLRDKHEVGLFSIERFLKIMREKGFRAKYLKKSLIKDRGLYIGVKE